MAAGGTLLPAGLALLLLLWLIDFYFDVRYRDALTWMDPYQYYNFALDLRERVRGLAEFELPSLFPLFILPFLRVHNSVPLGLCVNALFFLLLAVSVYGLCRRLRIQSQAFGVALALISSPLLIGLSRSLYVEFALSAVVALQYLIWLGNLEFDRPQASILFALLFALGVMMKMTYPLFFILPVLGAALLHLRARRLAALGRMLAAFLVPLLAVLAIQYGLLRVSFDYYLSLGNTRIPIMYMIGPAERLSLESITFYFAHIWKTQLFLLTPLLLVPVLAGLISGRQHRARSPLHRHEDALLWTWFLGAGLLLILQTVKEPRHVAPCVLPGVLLIFRSLADLRSPVLRRGLVAVAILLSLGQYALVTMHLREAPYFVDRASHAAAIEQAMVAAERRAGIEPGEPGSPARLRWLYSQNIAVSGFDPDNSLLLIWHLNPAIVYDLELVPTEEQRHASIAYRRFEDLYFLVAFTAYNRRCLWNRTDYTLDRERVINHADFLIVRGGRRSDLATGWPRHDLVASLPAGREEIYILRHSGPRPPSYRALYGRELLQHRPDISRADSTTIYFDLMINALLRGERGEVATLLAEYPAERYRPDEMRNIYWTGKALALRAAAQSIYARHYATGAPPPDPN